MDRMLWRPRNHPRKMVIDIVIVRFHLNNDAAFIGISSSIPTNNTSSVLVLSFINHHHILLLLYFIISERPSFLYSFTLIRFLTIETTSAWWDWWHWWPNNIFCIRETVLIFLAASDHKIGMEWNPGYFMTGPYHPPRIHSFILQWSPLISHYGRNLVDQFPIMEIT